MSPELRITPVPVPGGMMSLMLQGATLPKVGVTCLRQLPQLDPQLLESFRRNELTKEEFTQLRDAVTDWLLDGQVRDILKNALSPNGRMRLVIAIQDTARPYIADLPLELLWHDTPASPLLLRTDVQSLTYLLSETPGEVPPETSNWPFKALILRARPQDMDEVPEVALLAEEIRQLGANFGQRMVQVDVISSEPAIGVPATLTGLKQQLKKTSDYNILVYIGHGELQSSNTSGEPIGQLYMESDDGAGHLAVDAGELALLLKNYPIRMVLLAGCLTGADPVGTTRKRGGELGVAQALVNSKESGVQVAVAMRTELRTTAAVTFVRSFFQSLLDANPDPSGERPAGDVDRAVRAARRELYDTEKFPPQWAAPIVLRQTDREPFLEFLAQPVKFHVSERMDVLLSLRPRFWNGMADYSLAGGIPQLLQGRLGPLDDVISVIRAEGLLQGPLLLPRSPVIGAGLKGSTTVELAGDLKVKKLKGRVTAGNDGWVSKVEPEPKVAALFDSKNEPNDPGVFELTAKSGALTTIPEGDVLRVEIAVPAETSSGVHPLRTEILELTPAKVLWPGDTVVVVPRP